jgi:prepilin peptidase CpaA
MLVSSSFIAFGLLALLLLAASYTDLKGHRIPNVLTLGSAVVGLVLQAWFFGLDGVLLGLGGLALGLALYLPFYLLGGMGAGDVKLMAAVGAFLGPQTVLLAAGLSLIAGALIGLGVVLTRIISLGVLRPYLVTAKYLLCMGTYIPPATNITVDTRFPYAVAIAAGTLGTVFWLWV